MASFFKSISNILTAKCNCGARATSFPHGIPCCDECVHDVDCGCWLGNNCDCSKKEVIKEINTNSFYAQAE